MNHRSASGQILVLVLLVVLVALTIGLSIASRTLSTLRNSAELDQSNRAFSAAEAGIERALVQLKTNPNACNETDCSASISGVDAKVSVTDAGGTTDAFGVSTLDKDEVIQVNLDSYEGTSLDLYWGNNGDNVGATCPNASAVVVSVVYKDSSGSYGLHKGAYDGCLDSGRLANNFDHSSSSITVNPTTVLDLQDGETHGSYGYKVSLDLTPGGSYVASGSLPVMVRVRLMYVGDKPIAFDPGANVLPFQGQQIISTAVVGGKQRTVKVLKTTSSLPAIFDYALFNGSTSPLSK